MTTYDQFSTGGPLGNSFVRYNQDGTATQFFYDLASAVITVNEYTDNTLTSQIRTFQYNINVDNVLDYAFAVGSDYHIEVVDYLTPDGDHKTYNGYNHYIFGIGGDDILYAGDGQNQVYGGTGDDILSAGEHNDILFGEEGNDRVSGSSGQDYVFGGDDADYVSGGPGEDVLSGGLGDDEIRGGLGHDIIIDLSGNNNIHGEAGDDYVIAGDGDDYIITNEGYDIVRAGGGNDDVHGGSEDDILFGEGGNDRIFGGTHNDVIYGNEGNDYLEGEGDDDIIYGGAGADELRGGVGNDRLYADDGLGATPSNDKLRGNHGDDQLFGGDGVDTLYGGEDNDLLVGTTLGQSKMYGEAGADTFAFTGVPGGDAHRIQDFNSSEDFINISDILSGFDSVTDAISDFVKLVYRDATRTDIKVNVDGEGNDWHSLALLVGDYGGVTATDLYVAGKLITDNPLFNGDV